MTARFSDALAGLRVRQSGHDPGRVAVDLAVLLADGGATISDLAVLRNEPGLIGAVASDPTAWRVLSDVDDAGLARLRDARHHRAAPTAMIDCWRKSEVSPGFDDDFELFVAPDPRYESWQLSGHGSGDVLVGPGRHADRQP